MPPIGTAFTLSPTRLTEVSQIRESDIALAISLWKKFAPAEYRALITGGGALFGWDEKKRVFFYESDRRPIDPLRLRDAAIEPFLQNIRASMRFVSKRLQDGAITLPEWQEQMTQMVKVSQIAAALVANGGAENSGEDDTFLIALGIAAMLAYLQSFAQDIQAGAQPMNGLLLARSDLYALAGRDAYEEARRNGMINYTDAKEERRVLDPDANHCVTDEDGWAGCVELADLGWQPIGTLPRLYDTPCRTNCRCHFEFR